MWEIPDLYGGQRALNNNNPQTVDVNISGLGIFYISSLPIVNPLGYFDFRSVR